MMIVANKKRTIEEADFVSNKIINLIMTEMKKFKDEDEPAENIYFGVHIIGSLLAKICLAFESYGQIYKIDTLTTATINEWINYIAKEHLKLNQNQTKQ